MERGTWWQRLDAEEWVHRIGVAQTLLLTAWLVWACWLGVAAGLPVLVLFPASVVAVSGWFTSAWRRGRSWSWWAWAALAGLALLSGLAGLAQLRPGWSAFVSVLYGGLLLTLLCHPDSRARIEAPGDDREPSRDPAAPWVGRDY